MRLKQPQVVDGVTVNAVAGTHVVMLGFDLAKERRKGCLGFAVQREDHTEDERIWMSGMKTFAETDPGLGPGGQVSTRSHPIQTFWWADYAAKPDHDYTYTVLPLYGKPAALEEPTKVPVRIRTEPDLAAPHSMFFNRGSVATQEYARRFLNTPPDELKTEEERKAAYAWLSRGLMEALVAFVARAESSDYDLHAAYYEFHWPEVLESFREAKRRGAGVHVVYDAMGQKKNNEDAIAETRIKSLCTPRTNGKIMHNKFIVLSHKGQPIAVWTGSTNLSDNGIFGHMNNGHIVEDKAVAQQFLDYWDELRTDPEDKTDEQAWVAEHNPNPPDPWDQDLTAVFSPRKGLDVLDWYANEVAGKADEALFMTFAFGMDDRFKEIYRRKDAVLRMALMDKAGSGRNAKRDTALIEEIRQAPNVLIAIGNRIATNAFDHWLTERKGFGVQWVHTKFMLVDPLSDNPVVVAGSANFSGPSTDENNENMLVIRGDTRVADVYFGEYLRLWSHYAFREAVKRAIERKEPWSPNNLAPDDSWQRGYFKPGDGRSARRRYFARSAS